MHQRNRDDDLRRRLLDVRAEFRRLLAEDPPQRNKAAFYSGTSDSLPMFCAYLAAKNPAFVGARNLDLTGAGKFLSSLKLELISIFSSDFEARRQFILADGTTFSASINGFWRELSARYAQACSGIVHVLVAHDRTCLHQKGLEFWVKNHRPKGFLNDLRVFGFVEFPILVGALTANAGVSVVNIYIEPSPGMFVLLPNSPHHATFLPSAGGALQ